MKPQSVGPSTLYQSRSPRPKGRGRIEAFCGWPLVHQSCLSPRPKGRGRIEAGASSSSFGDICGLHGRKAVAELKLVKRNFLGYVAGSLHGRKAVAELKRRTSCRSASPHHRLHGRKAVAELKPYVRAETWLPSAGSPRPKGRGRIEAATATASRDIVSVVSTAERPWPN